MQVRITNVTDGPGKKPVEVRVYNKRLPPGAWMDVPIQFVDDKVRKLEQSGFIVIGKLPPWYSDYEARRKVHNLTPEEVAANLAARTKFQEEKAAKKAKAEAKPKTVEAPKKEAAKEPKTKE